MNRVFLVGTVFVLITVCFSYLVAAAMGKGGGRGRKSGNVIIKFKQKCVHKKEEKRNNCHISLSQG